MFKKLLIYIISISLIASFCPLFSTIYAQDTHQGYDFDTCFEKYKHTAAYAIAGYTGDYNATTFGDTYQDMYTFGYLYTKLVNPRITFNGYIYTIDEAKKEFGSDNQKVIAAEGAGATHYAPAYDNSFRHVDDVADSEGIKKDAWYSKKYYRGDKGTFVTGGIPFGIKDGSKISVDDKELSFVIEYLDNGYDYFYVQYVNTDWKTGNYTTDTYSVMRGNTNKWKTTVVNVPNAKFAPENDTERSAFCSGKEDFIIKGDNIYVSRIMVAKTDSYLNEDTDPDLIVNVKNEAVPCPKTVITDEKSGTTYNFMQAKGVNAIQPYVTSQNWNSDGTRFLVGTLGHNMFEYDTVNETLRFLDNAHVNSALNAFVTPDNQIYYTFNQKLYKIDWDTYERSFVCMLPKGCADISVLNVTNDGRYVSGYYLGTSIGAKVVRLDTETGEFDKKYNRKMYASNNVEISLGHPLINPEYENIIFFCGEGIDTNYLHERMFMVDTNTDKIQFIYEQSYVDETFTGEAAGHECWSASGDYLYFVKYDLAKTKGDNYVGRIPFKNGVFTGEREIINGDASYWHCYPSADDNWVAADTNTGEVYVMSAKNHNSYLIADFDMFVSSVSHPYQPHPHMSYNGKAVNWQMVSDKNNGDSLGVGWADISHITQGHDYTKSEFDLGDGKAIGYKNTKSDISTQNISDVDFVKAEKGNSIYFDIDDKKAKSVHQQMKINVTTYAENADTLNIGCTSAVHDKYEWYKYEDMNVELPVNAGINTYTVDLGYVNTNNICKYATDLYFNSKSGTTYIGNIEVIPYSNTFIDTYGESVYSFAGGKQDYSRGLDVFCTYKDMISVDDTDALYSKFGVTKEQAQEFKNAGFPYITEVNDNLWMYKSVADTDGITKNAWFTTRCKRVNTTSATTDLPGYIYFSVTNDVIVESDKQLIITIEYLDNRSESFNVLYTTDDGLKSHTITPKNTGKWQTYSFIVDDASFSNTNKTLLATRQEDFRIEAMRKDLYIASVCIEKPGNKEFSGITIGKDKVTLDAINKSSASSDVNAFVGVYDNFGVLNRVYKGEELSIDAASKNQLNTDITLNNGERVKVFAFEKNLTPYKTSNIDISYNNGNINVSWKKYISDKDVYYKVYMDGSLVCITTNNNYVLPDDQKTHKWNVEAVDFYGKPQK